jgi:hypothetical protein
MAKWQNDDMLDAALDYVAACDTLIVCSAQPTTYAEATATYALADVTLTPGDGNGDFTIADGDTNGRKVTVAAQSAVPIDASGTATHVALVLTTGSSLRFVTTCTSQALTSGGTVDLPAFDDELADAS